jgi:hypothetical protein
MISGVAAMPDDKTGERKNKTEIHECDLDTIIEMVEAVRFGSVTIVIQDHKIMQIEKNEKIRIN